MKNSPRASTMQHVNYLYRNLKINITFSLSLASLATVDPLGEKENKGEKDMSVWCQFILQSCGCGQQSGTAGLHLSAAKFTYLKVILLIHRQAVAENVTRDDHVGLVSVDGEAVHPQELRQKGGTMTFHNKLQ